MKHTLRAFLALSLLAALCLLALVVAGWFALIVYLVGVRDVPARALFFPILIGLVGLYVVLAVTRVSSRLARTAPLGLVLPDESQARVWQRVRALAADASARPPDEIRLVPDPRITISDSPQWLGLRRGTRRLEIGVPLVLALTDAQLQAALALELGGQSTTRPGAASVVRGTDVMRRISRTLGDDPPVGRVFASATRLYLRLALPVQKRQRDEGDVMAARVAGRDVVADTLHELDAVAEDWHAFLNRYVGPAHRIGLRPRAIAEGFLDLRDDPTRRSLLAEITHDEATLVRVERIEALPADGSHDDGLPGFAFLADPDVTMATFFDRLYGEDHELTTAEWDEILTAIPQRQVEEESSLLVDAVRSAPWRGGREATLDTLADELRLGRGMELARRVSDLRTAAEQQALVGTLVGSLLGRLLLDRGLATYQRTWAGPDVLRDGTGAVVDVIGLGNRAAGSADGVTAMLEFAETHGVASTEVFRFGADNGPGPLRILGCLAPLRTGFRPVVLAPCSRGLAVLRPHGLAEWLAVGQAPFVAGTARRLFDLLSAGAPADLVQRPHAEVLPWDDVADARLAERALRGSLLTITTHDGRRRRFTVLRSTDAHGDPWDPWDAIRHFLDDRFTQKRMRTGARRTGSRVGVPGP